MEVAGRMCVVIRPKYVTWQRTQLEIRRHKEQRKQVTLNTSDSGDNDSRDKLQQIQVTADTSDSGDNDSGDKLQQIQVTADTSDSGNNDSGDKL